MRFKGLEQYVRIACRVMGFRGSQSPSVGPLCRGPAAASGGSSPTPTHRVLLAAVENADRPVLTAWPNSYPWTSFEPRLQCLKRLCAPVVGRVHSPTGSVRPVLTDDVVYSPGDPSPCRCPCISSFLDPGSSPWGESYHRSRERTGGTCPPRPPSGARTRAGSPFRR